MLQQTQVATVKPYFERFVARFPAVADLAAADEQEVLRLWEGLGYYRRARQLLTAAQQIVREHGGTFPTELDNVLALPGIGRYTAGAILSIALDQRQPILEGNTLRVYSRLLGYRDDPRTAAGQRLLWEFAATILPQRRSGAMNQALMELGSEICQPRTPACPQCPLVGLCVAQAQGWQQQIPRPARPPQFEDLQEAAVVIRRRQQILLRRCGEQERWAGLWDFPRFSAAGLRPGDLRERTAELTGIDAIIGPPFTTIKHAVTRFRITLKGYHGEYQSGRIRDREHCRWVNAEELATYPLSATGRKLCHWAFES